MTDHPARMAAALVQSIHPEKVFDFLPGLTTANLAALYGLDVATYTAVREGFATMNPTSQTSWSTRFPTVTRTVWVVPWVVSVAVNLRWPCRSY